MLKLADEVIALAVDIAGTMLLQIEDAEIDAARQQAQLYGMAALFGGGGNGKRDVKWDVVKEL